MAFPHRTLGSGRLDVSALGLGCMGMSEFYGSTPADEPESVATIHRALDLGVTFFDSSDLYGPYTNEELLGRALKGRWDEVVLATKFGIVRDPANPGVRSINGRPAYVRQACEASLQRLGVDHIDLYYQHRIDPDTPIEDTVGALSDLVHEGKIRSIGLSEASPATLRRAAAVHPITALQSEWSLFARDIEAEVVPTCRELGIGIVAYSPLGRGLLTGTITTTENLADNDFRKVAQPRFQGDNLAHNLALVEEVNAVAADHDATSGQVALAWVLARGNDVVPIPGTRRRRYLEENVGAVSLVLTPDDLERLGGLEVAGARYADMRPLRGQSAPRPTP